MTELSTPTTSPLLHLSNWGVLCLQGLDAYTFANQLVTQSFSANDTTSKLAAFCLPNGRMLASFIGYPVNSERLHLITPLDNIEKLLKRLRMYVLRSKVAITNVSDEYVITAALTPSLLNAAPHTWRLTANGNEHTIDLQATQSVTRQISIKPKAESPNHSPENKTATLPFEQWHWHEVASSVLLITNDLSEQYTPQMFNYESLGAINFKKGCYPGQEVIARSQFRGQIKRRLFLVSTTNDGWRKGDELFLNESTTSPEAPLKASSESVASIIATAQATPINTKHLALVLGNVETFNQLASNQPSMQLIWKNEANNTLAHAQLESIPYVILTDL